jgi:hypothetical protein
MLRSLALRTNPRYDRLRKKPQMPGRVPIRRMGDDPRREAYLGTSSAAGAPERSRWVFFRSLLIGRVARSHPRVPDGQAAVERSPRNTTSAADDRAGDRRPAKEA